MTDRPVSVTIVSASALWIAAFVLAGVYIFVGTRGTGVLAILCMGGGATLTVRGFLITLADDLIERERNAFRVGLDAQRLKGVD